MNKKKKVILLSLCTVLLICVLGIVFIVNGKSHIPIVLGNKVDFVACGDATTVKLKVNGKEENIRLLGVVAPSMIERKGEEVKAYTCELFKQAKDITLEYEDEQLVDNFGVKLAWVFVDKELVQLELVKKGYANVNRIYGDYEYVEELKAELQNAKEKKLGIWKI